MCSATINCHRPMIGQAIFPYTFDNSPSRYGASRKGRAYIISKKAAIWLDDPSPIINEDHDNDNGGSDGGHVESRSLGLLTSSCWHVTRVASWSRDLSATVPRDDSDALHFKRRATSRSRSENHWQARPVGTGSSQRRDEGDGGGGRGRRRRRERPRRTEGRGRAAGEERRRTVFGFLRTCRLI